jgi:3'(2'), 5'-bisphosphate nucleotidase
MDVTTNLRLHDLLPVALEAAREASEAILEVYARDFDVDYKADASPLTEADRAAHAIIGARLATTGLPVLSEESGEIPYEERASWRRFWLVDPLDGTKEFVRRTGEFTVNIALIDGTAPVLGVVMVPLAAVAYWGLHGDGGGAWRADQALERPLADVMAAGEPIAADRSPAATDPLRVVASRSHLNAETVAFIDQLEADHGTVERVSRGSALKLCMIAEGAARIYPRVAPTMEWDTAAAQAIIEATGGGIHVFDPDLPAGAYLADPPDRRLEPLRYNKPNLLNPFFVAS